MIPHRHWLPAAALGVLAACGLGGASGVNPGNGGGPGGPGGEGNPLDVALVFTVTNDSTTERTETIRASVPFPRRGYQGTDNLVVSGHQTAWLPMQFWADGTVKMAQAQFTDVLAPGQTKTYSVARDEVALTGPFTRNAWVAAAGAGMQLGAEVRDTFSVDYRGLATGPGQVLQETPLVQVRRWRTYHMPLGAAGIGRDYLSSTFYATEFRDMPFVLVDWIVGNDYLGADTIPPGNTDPNLRPLGPVDVKRLRFLCGGVTAVQAYRGGEEGIAGPVAHGGGFTAMQVMQDTFLDDAQTRRYRFLLRFEPPGADPLDVARWRDVADAMLSTPLYPLATQQTWEETRAAGLLGGPIPGPSNSWSRAEHDWQVWRTASHFGTWGTHGDVKVTGTTGTPRNAPLGPELAHAIQANHHRSVQVLEQMAWIQAVRPYHLWNLQVGDEQPILLWGGLPHWASGESLGRNALQTNDPYAAYRTLNQGQQVAHGWEPFDSEHFSADLLFDYWTVSADAWAKEELRQLGESLKGLMRLRSYYTAEVQPARAEGWCMQAFAQVYQATQDERIKAYAMRRVNEIVDVGRHSAHPSKAMCYVHNYPASLFPFDHDFVYPWQHGAVLYGYLGAYKSFGEPALLAIAEDVVDTVQYCWVSNYNDPQFGYVAQGLRYFAPVTFNSAPIPVSYWDATPGIGIRWGDSPLGGAHTMLTGGLFHLAAMTSDVSVRARAETYGGHLRGALSENDRWIKWTYCLPSYYAQ